MTYNADDPCATTNNNNSTTAVVDGVNTRTYTNANQTTPQYNNTLPNSSQQRFVSDASNNGLGLQTVTATWAAPVNTFATFTAGPPPTATYNPTTTTNKTAVVKFNFYDQLAQPVVDVRHLAEQHGQRRARLSRSPRRSRTSSSNPIEGQRVTFLVTGPNQSSCNPTKQHCGCTRVHSDQR